MQLRGKSRGAEVDGPHAYVVKREVQGDRMEASIEWERRVRNMQKRENTM